jgi:hypothetical protein
LSYRVIDNERLDVKFYILLGLNVFLGFLTLYSFVILVWIVMVLVVFLMILKKQFNNIKKYLIAIIIGGVSGLLCYPKFIDFIRNHEFAVDAQNNLFNFNNFYMGLIGFLKVINKSVFDNSFEYWFIFIIITIIILFICLITYKLKIYSLFSYKNKIKNLQVGINIGLSNATNKVLSSFNKVDFINSDENTEIQMTTRLVFHRGKLINLDPKIIFTIIAAFCYFIVLAKVAPYLDMRYISCIFPAIAIIFLIALRYIIGSFDKFKKGLSKYILVLITIVFVIVGFHNKRDNLRYFYPDDLSRFSQIYKDSKSIIILEDKWPGSEITSYIFQLFKYKEIYLMSYKGNENYQKLDNILKNLDRSKETIIYIVNDRKYRVKQLSELAEKNGFNLKLFFPADYRLVYRLIPNKIIEKNNSQNNS